MFEYNVIRKDCQVAVERKTVAICSWSSVRWLQAKFLEMIPEDFVRVEGFTRFVLLHHAIAALKRPIDLDNSSVLMDFIIIDVFLVGRLRSHVVFGI